MPLTIAQIKNRVKPIEERFILEKKELTDASIL
jgi:uridine kinase